MRLPGKDSRGDADGLRVIGIDPGSRFCGYGVLEYSPKGPGAYRYVASGRIEVSSGMPLNLRLKGIYDELITVVRQYRPNEAAVERVFFAKGIKAALSLGHARGISLLAVTTEGVSVNEYSALEVKKAIVGYGRAEKKQVQDMVRAILNLKVALSPDSADALALSICHLNSMRFKEEVSRASAARNPTFGRVRAGRRR